MGMLEELRETVQNIEDARALIVCHPDDEASVRMAVRMLPFLTIAPRIKTDPWAVPGQALVFPDPNALHIVP